MFLSFLFEPQITSLEAENIVKILSLIGGNVFRTGNVINVIVDDKITSFLVTLECSGFLSFAIFTSLVLSTPNMGFRSRISTVSYGFSILYLINLARIIGAIEAFKVGGVQMLNIVHYVIGPVVLYITILVVWANVLKKTLKK